MFIENIPIIEHDPRGVASGQWFILNGLEEVSCGVLSSHDHGSAPTGKLVIIK
jgi:hypothetical protein